MVKNYPPIEALPRGDDEVVIKMHADKLTIGKAVIDSSGLTLEGAAGWSGVAGTGIKNGTMAASRLPEVFNPDDFVKKSDVVDSFKIINPGTIMLHSPAGPLSLDQLVERLTRLEKAAGTSPAGAAARIEQLEKDKLILMQRVLALEEALEDVPTSRPAW